MYRRLLFLSIVYCGSAAMLLAQQPLSTIAQISQDQSWIEMKVDVDDTAIEFMEGYKKQFGLTDQDHFLSLDEDKDRIGYTHNRIQQTHNQIAVEGAHYVIHKQDSRLVRANGHLVKNIVMPSEPWINAAEALDAAVLYTNAERYYWQDEQKEAMLRRIQDDNKATFYPDPQLVYAERNYSTNGEGYRLAWKMDIYAEGPKGKKTLFVDARDGHILFELEGCQEVSVEGEAMTKYHGLQRFITDSVSPNEFRLRDDSRLASISTFDLNTMNSIDISQAVDFIDEDNFWDNANAEVDEAATDVHWGMQETFDYFHLEHGLVSYDGDTSPIVSYVHVRSGWFNARWTGQWAEFGDGNGNPLTSIDVVAHELTHGVTGNSSGLIYRNESGALNESFSDIFGTAVEFHSTPATADWFLGLFDFQFRSLEDPHSFGDPDTYMGNNWITGEEDNGGVHTNSSVQNYWYYLLANGGTGTNDNGDFYDVIGIGRENAEAIAFRNNNVYLTPSSTFEDARQGAIFSAEDLFGPCTPEVTQTSRAWYAVGVGPDMLVSDLRVTMPSSPIISSCGFGTDEEVTINMEYLRSGCTAGIPAGTKIALSYTLDALPTVFDTIILDSNLVEGEVLSHTFATTVDLSEAAFYEFDITATFPDDLNPNNDLLNNYTIGSVKTVIEDELLRFNEFIRPLVPAYFMESNSNSIASTERTAASSGLKGVLMSGLNVNQANIMLPSTEEENFSLNQDYESRLCMCIDAGAWDSVSISFDLRQGYSEAYSVVAPQISNINEAIGIRLIADEIPVSQQFHPADTLFADTFVRLTINLDHLAGTYFNLCFQGKHFFGEEDDFIEGSKGDFSHIDEVELKFAIKGTATHIPALEESEVAVYPNPATDQIRVELVDSDLQAESIKLIDLTGKVIVSYQRINANTMKIDVTDLAPGIYLVDILTDKGRSVKKVVIK